MYGFSKGLKLWNFDDTHFQKSTETAAIEISDVYNLGDMSFNIAFGLLSNEFAPISEDYQLSDYISFVVEKVSPSTESGTV